MTASFCGVFSHTYCKPRSHVTMHSIQFAALNEPDLLPTQSGRRKWGDSSTTNKQAVVFTDTLSNFHLIKIILKWCNCDTINCATLAATAWHLSRNQNTRVRILNIQKPLMPLWDLITHPLSVCMWNVDVALLTYHSCQRNLILY